MAKNTPPPFFITKSTSCNDILHRNIDGLVLDGILIQQIGNTVSCRNVCYHTYDLEMVIRCIRQFRILYGKLASAAQHRRQHHTKIHSCKCNQYLIILMNIKYSTRQIIMFIFKTSKDSPRIIGEENITKTSLHVDKTERNPYQRVTIKAERTFTVATVN